MKAKNKDKLELKVASKAEIRNVSNVAGMLRKYKKSKPVNIEEMDQAIEKNMRGSQN
jgi:hypothetical protein